MPLIITLWMWRSEKTSYWSLTSQTSLTSPNISLKGYYHVQRCWSNSGTFIITYWMFPSKPSSGLSLSRVVGSRVCSAVSFTFDCYTPFHKFYRLMNSRRDPAHATEVAPAFCHAYAVSYYAFHPSRCLLRGVKRPIVQDHFNKPVHIILFSPLYRGMGKRAVCCSSANRAYSANIFLLAGNCVL